jgi:HEAT repeat protein
MIFMIVVVVVAVFVLTTMTKTGAIDTQLQSENADVRISAVDKLAEYGSGDLTQPFIGKRATELLSAALQDEDSGVRIAAAEGLGRIGNEDAIDDLAVALRDENADVVFAALHALECIGADEAVTAIANALDGDVALRQMSLCVLAETDNNSAQQVLRIEPDASLDPAKMKTLAVAALSNAFRESDAEGQLRIISALKNIGTSDATDAIASFLKLNHEEINLAAVNALVVIGDDGAVTVLAEALQSSNAALREKAANALKEIGSSSALDVLISTLESKKEDSQKNAALALTTIDNDMAEKALNALIEQGNLSIIAYIYDYFIREGIFGSEPVMIEALNRFGTTVMAEAFLNCGNSTLEEAATDWADRHGYDIIQSSWGGMYPKWGSH